MIGCDCEVCLSDNPRNHRTRSGVLVRAPEGDFVIDASPELRLQLVRQRVKNIEAAIFTHAHADHIMGLDDLRICGFRMDKPVGLYCEEIVEKQIRHIFHYAFDTKKKQSHKYAIPKFEICPIGLEPFELLGLTVQPIRLMHGPLPILGFRINNVAFCTDVSQVPRESWPLIQDVDVLVIDALKDQGHATHLSVKQAIAVGKQCGAKRTYLTHMSHELEYEATLAALPENVEPAWDGLVIPL